MLDRIKQILNKDPWYEKSYAKYRALIERDSDAALSKLNWEIAFDCRRYDIKKFHKTARSVALILSLGTLAEIVSFPSGIKYLPISIVNLEIYGAFFGAVALVSVASLFCYTHAQLSALRNASADVLKSRGIEPIGNTLDEIMKQ